MKKNHNRAARRLLAVAFCSLTLFLFAPVVYAQDNSEKMAINVILSGGGVKGFAFIGALERLEGEQGVQVEGLGGTSAGALIAALRSVGYSPAEMKLLLRGVNAAPGTQGKALKEFLDRSWFPTMPIYGDLFTKYGIYKGEELYTWTRSMLLKKAKTQLPQEALTNVYFNTVKRLNHDLRIVASDLHNPQKAAVFSAAKHGDNEVAMAVRMSAGIPLLFHAQKHPDTGHIYVDGGIIDNYPLHLFNDSNRVTIALKISNAPIAYPIPDSFESFLSAVTTILMDAQDRIVSPPDTISKRLWPISIDVGTVQATQFDIDHGRLAELIGLGRIAANKFLDDYAINAKGIIAKNHEATQHALSKLLQSKVQPSRSGKTLDAILNVPEYIEGGLQPAYLAENSLAIKKGAKIRRLMILSKKDKCRSEFLTILNEQRKIGVQIFKAVREEIQPKEQYKVLEKLHHKMDTPIEHLNAGLFDKDSEEPAIVYHKFGKSHDEGPLYIIFDQAEIKDLDFSSIFDLSNEFESQPPWGCTGSSGDLHAK